MLGPWYNIYQMLSSAHKPTLTSPVNVWNNFGKRQWQKFKSETFWKVEVKNDLSLSLPLSFIRENFVECKNGIVMSVEYSNVYYMCIMNTRQRITHTTLDSMRRKIAHAYIFIYLIFPPPPPFLSLSLSVVSDRKLFYVKFIAEAIFMSIVYFKARAHRAWAQVQIHQKK